jgi:hypothetical protein
MMIWRTTGKRMRGRMESPPDRPALTGAGARVSFEVVKERGKEAAANLKLV